VRLLGRTSRRKLIRDQTDNGCYRVCQFQIRPLTTWQPCRQRRSEGGGGKTGGVGLRHVVMKKKRRAPLTKGAVCRKTASWGAETLVTAVRSGKNTIEMGKSILLDGVGKVILEKAKEGRGEKWPLRPDSGKEEGQPFHNWPKNRPRK